jgi:outer membrane immunogenic protein
MRLSTRIIIAAVAALLLIPALASADEAAPADDVVVPAPRSQPAPQPVAAAPPAFVRLETTSIAAGIGVSWGDGTLTFQGRDYDFELKGISLIDLGASSSVSVGDVQNLENLADFEGTYVALEAAGAAGSGASAVTMRNENGVVITLNSELRGVQLALATQGLRITLSQ